MWLWSSLATSQLKHGRKYMFITAFRLSVSAPINQCRSFLVDLFYLRIYYFSLNSRNKASVKVVFVVNVKSEPFKPLPLYIKSQNKLKRTGELYAA